MRGRLIAELRHPTGLAMVGASAALALLLALVPGWWSPWSERAPTLLLWGVAAALLGALVEAWSKPFAATAHPAPAETPKPREPASRGPLPLSNGETLTRSEVNVLRLLATGLTDKEIAERLVVQPSTVETHARNIRDKLGVGNRGRAIAWAIRNGVVPSDESPDFPVRAEPTRLPR